MHDTNCHSNAALLLAFAMHGIDEVGTQNLLHIPGSVNNRHSITIEPFNSHSRSAPVSGLLDEYSDYLLMGNRVSLTVDPMPRYLPQ